ncbi:hypothetical protein QBC43DRAFT_248993 [Cladorrhinum sp. PSN259]|nr:hypothetical protein QBC43DRAFT_248993 [Cladorrhinum sp. PSN259]
MSSKPGPVIHFVVSTGTEKADPELRKFIRSHVMQGKNKGKKLPSRKRKPTAATATSPAAATTASQGQTGSAVAPLSSRGGGLMPVVAPPHQQKPGEQLFDITVTLQRNRLSSASCMSYADKNIEPYAVEVVFQFSIIAKSVLFPLESCIYFEHRAEQWTGPLGCDDAFLHALIFSAQCFFDAQASASGVLFVRSPSRKALPHLIKAIEILRERFAEGGDEEARKSLTTVSTITSLAALAHASGDEASARNHLEGLYKIVEMRGGMDSFAESDKLLVEILRTDLGIALFQGTRTRFFSDKETQPLVELPDLCGLVPSGMMAVNKVPKGVNGELVGIWKVLRDFTAVVNYATGARKLISMRMYGDSMSSTMYRLLDMEWEFGRDETSSPLDEVVRLGLLAYSAHVFLQWKRMTHCKAGPYRHLAGQLRKALQGMRKDVQPELRLWLIMVAAVGALDVSGQDQVWLGEALRNSMRLCGLKEWGEVRTVLEEVMWIGLVYDEPGKRMLQGLAMRTIAFTV